MRDHRWNACLVVLAACLTGEAAHGQKYDRNSYLGKAPPEIVSDKEHWIGAAEPLTLAKLKGKVVWLHFNF
jgi:hypothetical protein